MNCVFVLGQNGECLMPTKRFGHIRHLLQDGKAIIIKYRPFTVKLQYSSDTYIQPMEMGVDVGYENIGISIKSEKEEYVSEERKCLNNEKSKHDDCRKYRRTRRNRLRYRKPKWSNRTRSDGWIAPSLKHKADSHVNIINGYCSVAPIKNITIEIGKFDPALLKAFETGQTPPKGVEYQQGPLYFADSLRAAVFMRDNYTCQICKRSSIDKGLTLHTHHALFWEGRHGNTLGELLTVCSDCHTAANHQKDGKLWGLKPKVAKLEPATFMNVVRWYIFNTIQNDLPCVDTHITYGSVTARKRKDNNIDKTHANDAYCIGEYMPLKRAETEYFQKVRRNNRVLEKFYDAKYIDTRTGNKASGKDLSCGRTNRKEPRQSENNLRVYRGEKVSKGRRSIRKKSYAIRPGDLMLYNNRRYTAKGVHCNGTQVILNNSKSVAINKVTLIRHTGGWVKLN